MVDYSVKLSLSREQRRSLDRAAKLEGLKTGPWARSKLLGLVAPPSNGQSAPAVKLQGNGIIRTPADAAEAVLARTGKLVKSFDPDA